MRIENISDGKIIGVGSVTVLPGETKEIPQAYETSPILEVYKQMGMVKIIGKSSGRGMTKAEADALAAEEAAKKAAAEAAKKAAAEKQARADAEALRKARLAALNGIGEEDLGRMANELGINPADCKDQADVLKKVRAALKKG